jgi:hypothetical protein
MEWKFVTPTAAHHHECAESLIRVTKAVLKKSIGDQVLAPLECQTVLFEAANLLNQRPIGRTPNDLADGTYICPNDILLGRASTNTPQCPFRETKNPRHRYEFWRSADRRQFLEKMVSRCFSIDGSPTEVAY